MCGMLNCLTAVSFEPNSRLFPNPQFNLNIKHNYWHVWNLNLRPEQRCTQYTCTHRALPHELHPVCPVMWHTSLLAYDDMNKAYSSSGCGDSSVWQQRCSVWTNAKKRHSHTHTHTCIHTYHTQKPICTQLFYNHYKFTGNISLHSPSLCSVNYLCMYAWRCPGPVSSWQSQSTCLSLTSLFNIRSSVLRGNLLGVFVWAHLVTLKGVWGRDWVHVRVRECICLCGLRVCWHSLL